MTFEELLLALDEHSNLISNETKIGHNTNVRVGLLGKKVAEIFRKQGDAGERYLSKIDDDIAKGIITFLKGIVIGDFSPGLFGSGGAIKNINGTIVAEFDQLLIRQRAEFLSVLIHQAKHIGGELVQSAAEMICIKVEETTDFYRCYFDADDGKVVNLFENTDFARHQVFTGSKQKFYWRKIVAVGPDYIELSKTDAAINSDIPEVGDYIYQLGSENTERQGAIILSTVGPDAPSIKQYVNINTYALSSENEYTVFSRMGNKIQGKTVFRSNGLNYDDWADGTSQDIQDAQAAANAAALTAQQAIDDAAANVADYNQKFADIQAQVDGEISNYSYPYTPTLLNYPASDWATDIEKDRHIGDVFHNSQAFVDNETTPDSGKAWRFVKNGTAYSWTPIADSDAVKAIQEASKAQAMADGKSTTYLLKPDTPKADGYCYHFGDMWVLNSDITLNGTAYKQGEILTATQDSETFVQAHWLKRIRYTDDTAIDNLEIGGKNLFQLNDAPNRLSDRFTLSNLNNSYARMGKTKASLVVGKTYTFFSKIRYSFKPTSAYTGGTVAFFVNANSVAYVARISAEERAKLEEGETIEHRYVFTLDSKDSEDFMRGYTPFYGSERPDAIFIEPKLVEGDVDKKGDWTPAPEDVQANIETAKTEAENAAEEYANTKAEAERVIAEAYADGIVTAEEQARIDDVNDKLAAAKEYADAQDELLKIQQEAYADGKISTAEQAAIDAARDYADLKKTEAEAYADGIVSDEEARAIADALEKFNASKAHAETLVNNLEIGGKNLFQLNDAPNRLSDRFTLSNLNNSYARMGKTKASLVVGKTYTFFSKIRYSFKPTSAYTGGTVAFFVNANSVAYVARISAEERAKLEEGETIEHRYVFTLDSKDSEDFMRGYTPFYGSERPDAIFIEPKLVEGDVDKKGDWTPAPEDVDKKITDVDAKAAEAQAKANKSAAITDKFGTDITGGLITTVMMLLREANSIITTAGFSGIQGALLDQPSYWSGGTHIQAQAFVPFVKKLENEQSTTLAEYNNLPSIVFLHNGAAKIGHFIVLTSGEILIIDKNTGAIKLKFSTSDLPAIADLIAGTNSSGSTPIGVGVASNSSSQVVSGSTQITKNGATATFNGTYISISATGKVQTNGIESFAEAVLYARKDGVRLHRLATSIVDFHSEVYEEKYNEWPPIPRSFITDAGTYTFELVVHTEGLVSSATAITSSTNFSWKHVVAGVKQQQYAKDGMMFFYSNRHFYFNELTGLDVKESDSSKFNMPGVLAAGSSTSGGIQSNVWGAKSSTANITPITGGFRVPLSSLSHSNYVVQITPHTNTTFRVSTKTSTYFEVYGTGGFDYVVIGNNYA